MNHRPLRCLSMVLLVAVAACQSQTAKPPGSQNGPPSGCRVERQETAEQAVRQLFDHSDAYVYSIDGDPASCKFEASYKADEASEENPIFTASGDSVAEQTRLVAGVADVDTGAGNNHHLLVVVVPEYPPRPEDKYVFSVLMRASARGEDDEKNCESRSRKSEEAGKLLPASVLMPGTHFGHGGSPATGNRTLKQGEEFTPVDITFHRSDPAKNEPNKVNRTDLVRYRLTVKCLDEGVDKRHATDDALTRKELAKWEGDWDTGYGATLTIKGDRWTSHAPGSAVVAGKLKVIEIRPTLTLTDLLVEEGETKGQTCKMIFRLEGDTLHECGTYSEQRPAEFKSTYENQNVYYAWKRTRK